MDLNSIPYRYKCKEMNGNCLCTEEQMKVCPSCTRIVDEDALIKQIREEKNKKSNEKSKTKKKKVLNRRNLL